MNLLLLIISTLVISESDFSDYAILMCHLFYHFNRLFTSITCVRFILNFSDEMIFGSDKGDTNELEFYVSNATQKVK